MNYVVESYKNYKEENRLTTNNARTFVCVIQYLSDIRPELG